MNNWKSLLKNDPTEWLLEENNPSIRYFTLVDILEKSEDSPEVVNSKKQIMKSDLIQKILSKQNENETWNLERTFNSRFITNIEKG